MHVLNMPGQLRFTFVITLASVSLSRGQCYFSRVWSSNEAQMRNADIFCFWRHRRSLPSNTKSAVGRHQCEPIVREREFLLSLWNAVAIIGSCCCQSECVCAYVCACVYRPMYVNTYRDSINQLIAHRKLFTPIPKFIDRDTRILMALMSI